MQGQRGSDEERERGQKPPERPRAPIEISETTMLELTEVKRLPLKEMLMESLLTVHIKAARGDIVLRKAKYLDVEQICLELFANTEYLELQKIVEPLREAIQNGEATAEQMLEFRMISTRLRPYALRMEFAAFVYPDLMSMDPGTAVQVYDALMSSLTSKERMAFQELIGKLTNTEPNGELDPMFLAVSQKYGIKIDLKAEDLTASQWAAIAKAETKLLKKAAAPVEMIVGGPR